MSNEDEGKVADEFAVKKTIRGIFSFVETTEYQFEDSLQFGDETSFDEDLTSSQVIEPVKERWTGVSGNQLDKESFAALNNRLLQIQERHPVTRHNFPTKHYLTSF